MQTCSDLYKFKAIPGTFLPIFRLRSQNGVGREGGSGLQEVLGAKKQKFKRIRHWPSLKNGR